MGVPNVFGSATTSIPLSQLDANFNTTATLGNAAVGLGNTTTTVGNLTLTNTTIGSVSTPITPAQGGTGLNTLTANNVLIGNGTSNVTFVAPGSNGNILISNGTSWISQAASSGVSSLTAGRGFAVSSSTGAVTGSLAAGTILQVVSTVVTSYQSTTSSSMVTASLAVSITPQSSSNKIYVTASLSGSQSASNGSGYFTLYRNSTDLGSSNGLNVLYTNASFGNPFRIPVCMEYLDSPSTTSSTTYTVYFKTNTVGTVALNQDSTSSVITVMEVAG